jgi:hypothetical protein
MTAPAWQSASVGWQDVTQSDAIEVADWIAPRLLPFHEYRIGSVIPTGFARYVRIEPRAYIADVLRVHTTTPDRCWLCLWDGYGDLHGPPSVAYTYFWSSDTPEDLRRPPPPPPQPKLRLSRVRLPNRDYLLFTGSVEQGDGWERGPELWWPDDRAWCVASEIDLAYTLVGGSDELCGELIAGGAEFVLPEDRN